MKTNAFNYVCNRTNLRGFTLTELLVVLGMMVILSGILLATPDHSKEKSYVLTDLSNQRQILAATSAYRTDHQDYMPHPTWGSVDGSNFGTDGWAYAVKNKGIITNAPAYIPNCAGLGINSIQYSNQVQFFKIGQLAPYLPGLSVMYCPKDEAQWDINPFKTWFLGRNMKLTSYVMNGTVGGYCGPNAWQQPTYGKAQKASAFKPMDIIYWEENETDGFFFNDASSNPESAGEGVTQRHYGSGTYQGYVNTSGGGGVIGRLNGAAEFMRYDQFISYVKTGSTRPNDLLNGPGYP